MKELTLNNALEEELQDHEFREYYEKAYYKFKIADEIAKAREMAGLTQKELAEKMGTTPQVVYRLENGSNQSYTFKILQKIAAATGTELDIQFRSKQTRDVVER